MLAGRMAMAVMWAPMLSMSAFVSAQQVQELKVTPGEMAAIIAGEPKSARPPLLFRELWQFPPHDGRPTDDNSHISQAIVTNPDLQLLTYGPEVQNVIAATHEGLYDLWTGLAHSPVAILLRDRKHLIDLRGLARTRAILRTWGLHALHPVIQLPDGSLFVSSQTISTAEEYVQIEVDYGNRLNSEWFKLDPKNLWPRGAGNEHPDLSRVDAVGFVDLAPGGGHGSASANFGQIEVYAVGLPR